MMNIVFTICLSLVLIPKLSRQHNPPAAAISVRRWRRCLCVSCVRKRPSWTAPGVRGSGGLRSLISSRGGSSSSCCLAVSVARLTSGFTWERMDHVYLTRSSPQHWPASQSSLPEIFRRENSYSGSFT